MSRFSRRRAMLGSWDSMAAKIRTFLFLRNTHPLFWHCASRWPVASPTPIVFDVRCRYWAVCLGGPKTRPISRSRPSPTLFLGPSPLVPAGVSVVGSTRRSCIFPGRASPCGNVPPPRLEPIPSPRSCSRQTVFPMPAATPEVAKIVATMQASRLSANTPWAVVPDPIKTGGKNPGVTPPQAHTLSSSSRARPNSTRSPGTKTGGRLVAAACSPPVWLTEDSEGNKNRGSCRTTSPVQAVSDMCCAGTGTGPESCRLGPWALGSRSPAPARTWSQRARAHTHTRTSQEWPDPSCRVQHTNLRAGPGAQDRPRGTVTHSSSRMPMGVTAN